MSDERLPTIYLSMGAVMGGLMDDKLMAEVVEAVSSGGLHRGYVKKAHDLLGEILLKTEYMEGDDDGKKD